MVAFFALNGKIGPPNVKWFTKIMGIGLAPCPLGLYNFLKGKTLPGSMVLKTLVRSKWVEGDLFFP